MIGPLELLVILALWIAPAIAVASYASGKGDPSRRRDALGLLRTASATRADS